MHDQHGEELDDIGRAEQILGIHLLLQINGVGSVLFLSKESETCKSAIEIIEI